MLINNLPKSLIDSARAILESAEQHPMIDVDGVMKHRHNSNGTPIHSTDEGIRNFHRWFGDSKVVDEHGRPQVVYHGTGADVGEFDPKKIGKTFAADKSGFFFSSNPSTATEYAEFAHENRSGYGNVIPAYVTSSNPMTRDALQKASNIELKPRHGDGTDSLIRLYDEFRDEITHYVKEGKHDGVVLSRNEHHLVVALHPSQIKSAIGNNGDFSHPSKITESTDGDRPFTTDEHGKNIVFDNGTYKISVNDPDDATYIALWHQKDGKVGEMHLCGGRTADTKGYATVSKVEIAKKHRGNGLSTHMYRAALRYSHAKYKGVSSEYPDRVNNKQVPAIYRRLGGVTHDSGDITVNRTADSM